MMYEQVWAMIAIFWVLGLAALWVWREHLRRRHKERLREMAHRERMLALERQVPLPELLDLPEPAEAPDAGWETLGWRSNRPALSCGILGMAGGGALLLAFTLSGNDGLREIWSLGFIPLLLGIGLLFVDFLERRAGRPR